MSVDLRNNYTNKQDVVDGTLYQHGTIVQVWWDLAKPQTWSKHLTEQQAIEHFNKLLVEFNQVDEFV